MEFIFSKYVPKDPKKYYKNHILTNCLRKTKN